MLEFFLVLQLLVYILLFNLQLPAISDIILGEFRKLIEFDLLNPEKFIQNFIDPEFTINSVVTGVKQAIESEDQEKTVLKDLLIIFFIIAAVFTGVVIAVIAAYFCKEERKQKIFNKLRKFKEETFFNGLIVSLKISLF